MKLGKTKYPENRPFIIANQKGIDALPFWLKKRKYNSWIWPLSDKHGNSMIGLSWDYDINNDWSKRHDPAGLIIVKNKDLTKIAVDVVEEHSR